jgi:antitoxin VapB
MERAMAKAKVFRTGNSQAVRLPKEFRFASKEVEIFKRGEEVVLREKPRTLAEAFDILSELPIDESIKDTRSPEERDGL